jgi:hypothetical protein
MAKSIFLRPDITTSQNLASGPLSYTTSINRIFKLQEITIHFTVPSTETITITRDSVNGANYDHILATKQIPGEQDYVYRPQGEQDFQIGDEIKVQCTNAGGAGVAYCTIKTRELS